MSLLKPCLSQPAICDSYSDRNLARRSCPQTSGDLMLIVPYAVMTAIELVDHVLGFGQTNRLDRISSREPRAHFLRQR